VDVFDDGTLVGTAATHELFWTVTLVGVRPGAHSYAVRARDAAGNAGPPSGARGVVVDAPPAEDPPVVVATPPPQTGTQPPGPTTSPAPTPPPPTLPVPVPDQVVVAAPAGGTVLVKVPGSRSFQPLSAVTALRNGAEIDVRKGRVTLTSIPRAGAAPETADFYGGVFVLTQRRGITDVRLSEPLDGCPKAGAGAAAAKAKAKTRKLWGDGKGAFRTTGRYSAATVRGTRWLVQDTCATTLTRVTQGVVAVRDFAKKRTRLVRQGQRYTARRR
jgi:hypothetical protein